MTDHTFSPNEIAQFAGQVVLPDHADYDQLRTMFYGGIDIRPTAVIRVKNSSDIQHAIALAHSHQLPLAVRSGGHSLLGHSNVEGGIVIDLRDMKKLEVDADNYVAWAETGLTAGEVTHELDKENFVLGFGDTGSVGIGGITLGGGIGFLTRKFGMTIDNMLAAEVVLANGKIVIADAANHPDLFWALRGGGGNFGVVTRFKFKLHKLKEAFGGMMILPATSEGITEFMKLAESAPNELSGILNILPCPPMPFVPAEHHGHLVMMALLMYAGDPQQGAALLQPLRDMKPLADLTKPMRYTDLFPPENGSYHPLAVSVNMFIHHVDKSLAEKILVKLSESDAQMRVVQLRVFGGVAAEVPVDATAFAHRHSEIMVNVASFYTGPEDKAKRQQWVNETVEILDQGDSAVYSNFIGDNNPKWVKAAYPEAIWKRLREVKQKYDPENTFRSNHNIW